MTWPADFCFESVAQNCGSVPLIECWKFWPSCHCKYFQQLDAALFLKTK